MPHGNGCEDGECRQCIFEPEELKIVSSEPVMLCEDTMAHFFCGQNLTVLSIPGYYAFELCREASLGKVTIEVEEITAEVAKLIPQTFSMEHKMSKLYEMVNQQVFLHLSR